MDTIWGIPIVFDHKRVYQKNWGLPVLFSEKDKKLQSIDYSTELSWNIDSSQSGIPFEIVIRSSHERTTEMCIYFLNMYAPHGSNVNLIYRSPFANALKKSFEIGASSRHDFLFVIDADVIPLKNVFESFQEFIKSRNGEFDECHAKGYCGLYLKTRSIGPRIYNKKCLSKMIPKISSKDVRPESDVIARCRLKKHAITDIICLHDFGQWRRDIYRKGMLYYKKHKLLEMERVVKSIKEMNNENYNVFLKGIENHESLNHSSLMNSTTFPSLPDGISERLPIDYHEYNILLNRWINEKVDV